MVLIEPTSIPISILPLMLEPVFRTCGRVFSPELLVCFTFSAADLSGLRLLTFTGLSSINLSSASIPLKTGSILPCSHAFSTAPIAPMVLKLSGMRSSSLLSPNTFLRASLTPWFSATPPWKIMGARISLPLARVAFRFLTRARQRPATMSRSGTAVC